MKWLKKTLNRLAAQKTAEARPDRESSLSQIEHLEPRLCLGAFDAPEMGSWTPQEPAMIAPANTNAGVSTTQPPLNPYGASHAYGYPAVGNSEPIALQPSTPMVPETPNPTPPSGAIGSQINGGLSESVLPPAIGDNNGQSEGNTPSGFVTPETNSSAASPSSADQLGAFGGNIGAASNGVAVSGGATGTGIENVTTIDTESANGAGAEGSTETEVRYPAWWEDLEEPVTIKYDFRSIGDYENYITDEEIAVAEQALTDWSSATGGILQFERDIYAENYEIMNIGTGALEAFGHNSGQGGTLGLGGGAITQVNADADINVAGVAWLDVTENWDTEIGNGDVAETVDYYTVLSHEIGHVIGLEDGGSLSNPDIMRGYYNNELTSNAIDYAAVNGSYHTTIEQLAAQDASFEVYAMSLTQLSAEEVERLLRRASAATASDDAVIAVVDRAGSILGVLAEDGVLRNINDSQNTASFGNGNMVIDTQTEREAFSFFVEGAVAKARTAAIFSNGDPNNTDSFSPGGTLAPLTSRLVRFISQTTITEREVEGRPTVRDDFDQTLVGPGYVAPIGVGGHFPPEVNFTPPVDLFAIEHTNRDRVADRTDVNPNQDVNNAPGAGDILRFNIPFEAVDPNLVAALREPLSFGELSGLDPNARSRGVATLPGGIPIFRDTNGDGVGETLVGGIGVFFPGRDGFATFEQNFIPGIGQTEEQRTNAPKVLEAEYMALMALGGSQLAAAVGIPLASTDIFAADPGLENIESLDLPFGRLDLVGITLQVVGPIANRQGVGEVIAHGMSIGRGEVNGTFAAPDGTLTQVDTTQETNAANFVDGREVPHGFIVPPRDGSTAGSVTADEVQQIIEQAIAAAEQVRAAVRLRADTGDPSSRTRMVFSVTDLDGNVVGLFRMQDATIFSIDVAVAKARNVTYYASDELVEADQLEGVPEGTAFTNRTFRFLAEGRFPSGIDQSPPGPFSTLNNSFINPYTAENNGAAQAAEAYQDTVLGRNSFDPSVIDQTTNFNFADVPGNDPDNQNGIVFFPGSTPLYRDGVLIGGFGVSGDGVDQDDVVTFLGAQGFLPQQNGVLKADQVKFRDVRLPYQKFLRNPFG
ncbi:matrixin family metalloprotease [Thalassoroseus pseudoceratinae]|uniref:matrixin family metalloprotease n=1 Tax=Thalassoroseus pseudoceratinae TaxID=2713176 RepID=UPI0014233B7C|nr:matrixin family metalloprotease [Thalassoroseus pseudoceratinae]